MTDLPISPSSEQSIFTKTAEQSNQSITQSFTIDNFSCHFNDESIPISYIFPCDAFYLELYPTGVANESFVSVLLNFSSILDQQFERNHNELENSVNMKIRVDLSIINSMGEKSHTKVFRGKLHKSKDASKTTINLFSKYINRLYLIDPANGFLPGDKLTMLFQIEIKEEKPRKLLSTDL